MTCLTNERDIRPGYADSSIPQIAWGKYRDEDGRKTLNISMEVNHRFVDGLNIGRFSERQLQIVLIQFIPSSLALTSQPISIPLPAGNGSISICASA